MSTYMCSGWTRWGSGEERVCTGQSETEVAHQRTCRQHGARFHPSRWLRATGSVGRWEGGPATQWPEGGRGKRVHQQKIQHKGGVFFLLHEDQVFPFKEEEEE